jgi:hypothetical protein
LAVALLVASVPTCGLAAGLGPIVEREAKLATLAE